MVEIHWIEFVFLCFVASGIGFALGVVAYNIKEDYFG